MSSDLHAVFATDGKNQTFRVSDPLSWDEAVAKWTLLDEYRRTGSLPQVKFFEVRSVTLGPDRPLVGPEVRSHGRYDGAPLNLNLTKLVSSGRGFANVQDAARRAWHEHFPTFTQTRKWGRQVERVECSDQGRGGWYFYPNGQTAAQGLHSLAPLAKRRGMVVEGVDGRWYPVQRETL